MDQPTSSSVERFQALMAAAQQARRRNEHGEAQRLFSEAHRLRIAERVRLQQLKQAQDEADALQQRIRERDLSCATMIEFRERHPEYRYLVTKWEAIMRRIATLQADRR